MSLQRHAFRPAFLALAVSLALAGPFAGRADAVLIVSNFAETLRDATPIANPEYWAAQSFATDAEYVLTSIAAQIGNAFGDPDAVIELRLGTTDEIDLSPGGLLTTFAVPDLSGPIAARIFTPNAAVLLAPGNAYWFVVGTNTGGFDLAYSQSDDMTVGPGAIMNFADSSDAGVTYINRGSDFPYFLEVNGEVVPEPGTLLLAGIGLGALGWRGRRHGAA